MIIPSLSAEDDEGNELSYFPLFTSNEQIDNGESKIMLN